MHRQLGPGWAAPAGGREGGGRRRRRCSRGCRQGDPPAFHSSCAHMHTCTCTYTYMYIYVYNSFGRCIYIRAVFTFTHIRMHVHKCANARLFYTSHIPAGRGAMFEALLFFSGSQHAGRGSQEHRFRKATRLLHDGHVVPTLGFGKICCDNLGFRLYLCVQILARAGDFSILALSTCKQAAVHVRKRSIPKDSELMVPL